MLSPSHIAVVRRVRKACEHSCLAGAGLDLAGSILFREQVVLVLIFGKLALLCGAFAVFLVHFEEAHHIE